MLLLLHDDFAQHLAERKLAHGIGLPNALPVLANGFLFIIQIELQHSLRIFGRGDLFGRHFRHATKLIDLFGDPERMS